MTIVCIGVSSPSKTPTPFAKSPLKPPNSPSIPPLFWHLNFSNSYLNFQFKPSLSINFRFYIIFYVKTAISPEKCHHLFQSNPPLKIEILSSPLLLFENLVRSFNSRAERGEVVHAMVTYLAWLCQIKFYFRSSPRVLQNKNLNLYMNFSFAT